MAFSQSLSGSVRQKGQTALLCQLCEIDPKIKWKCLECGIMMCQRCSDKVHPKFASAEDHTIIDIKDISEHEADSEPKLNMAIKLKCDVHTGKTCCLYCKSCQELVCQTCITKTHNTHNFGEIDDEYHTKLDKINTRHGEIAGEKKKLDIQKQKLQQIKSTQQSEYDKVKQEIHDNEKALINEIKKHTNKLLTELDEKWEQFLNSIEDEAKHLDEKQSQLQNQIQAINILLESSNAEDMFSGFNSVIKSQPTNIPQINRSFHGVPKLTDGHKTKIPYILGKLKNVTVQCNTELTVDKIFDTKHKYLYTVVSCPNDCLWISNFTSGIIQKVKPHEDNLSVISNIRIKAFDAALLPSGDLLLSVAGSSNLKLIPFGSTEIQDSVYTVSPLYPTCVHATFDNQVIVGAEESKTIQVIMMGQTGHHKKIFRYDRHNKPLLTFPHRITSNRRGNIAVIDWITNDYSGRVVVLDQEGEVRNIYTGHPDVNNKDNAFIPAGIKTTPSDNFVVADPYNHALHILNSEGEIITFYNTEEMGILLPYSLSFSTTGQLYIGSVNTSEDSKDNAKAKLYQVNFIFL